MSMERLAHPYLLSEITRLKVEGKTFGKRIADLERDMAELKARLLAGPGPPSVEVAYPIPGTAYPVSIPGTANPSPPGEPGPDEVPSSPGDARPGAGEFPPV